MNDALNETLNDPVYRVVREIFGSVASVGIVGSVDLAVIEHAFDRLNEIDRRFSPYRADSEISRLRDGLLHRSELHPETAEILARCAALRIESGGRFDVDRASRDGRLDPSGYVKGWAIGEAHRLLRTGGAINSIIGIGGDLSASGLGPGGVGWVVGVADPRQRDRAATRVALRDQAIATSGVSEQAEHLRDPSTGESTTSPWLSFTVIGPVIDRVDALATICYLDGAAAFERLATLPGYGGLGLAQSGAHQVSPLFQRAEV